MDDFITRMITERDELLIKTDKLLEFIKTDKFDSLSAIEKNMLLTQAHNMIAYHHILDMRIKYYSK